MFGTHQQIPDQICRIRDETGVSYLGVSPHRMEAFAPVLGQLA